MPGAFPMGQDPEEMGRLLELMKKIQEATNVSWEGGGRRYKGTDDSRMIH